MPLRPPLARHVNRGLRRKYRKAATYIIVGFVMPSGVRRIEGHIRGFLGKGGRLRLLTGDYLGLIDPDALE